MWEILKEAILKIILKETVLKPWSLSFLIDLWGRFSHKERRLKTLSWDNSAGPLSYAQVLALEL